MFVYSNFSFFFRTRGLSILILFFFFLEFQQSSATREWIVVGARRATSTRNSEPDGNGQSEVGASLSFFRSGRRNSRRRSSPAVTPCLDYDTRRRRRERPPRDITPRIIARGPSATCRSRADSDCHKRDFGADPVNEWGLVMKFYRSLLCHYRHSSGSSSHRARAINSTQNYFF